MFIYLCSQDAHASSGLDFLLGESREVLGLDDNGVAWESAFAEHLVVTGIAKIENWSLNGGLLFGGLGFVESLSVKKW